MALRLIKDDGDKPLEPPKTGITPEQERLYREAHAIFGDSGANRPDAPGQPVSAKTPSKLGKARFASAIRRAAITASSGLLPEFRDQLLQRVGLDPKAIPDASTPAPPSKNRLKLTTDTDEEPAPHA